MKYDGRIIRVQHDTLIIETMMGLRGVELDEEVWDQIRADFELDALADLIGWAVEYDPAHGDLEITAPGADEQAGTDENAPSE
jgi:hypothetical protein